MRKKNPYFHFKQFSVNHGNASMKVGTDGVLLGCWVNIPEAKTILDIGTGSGLIALMLAQRTPEGASIDAVEIEPEDVTQAIENVRNSPWPEKIRIHHTAVQQFRPGKKYDLIVSNPPFFINSFVPPVQRRKEARHTTALSFPDLLGAVKALLAPEGRFNLILPAVEGAIFREYALEKGFHCNRRWDFRSKSSKPVERWLMEFAFIPAPEDTGEIVMYEENGEWTAGFKALSRDFYLKL